MGMVTLGLELVEQMLFPGGGGGRGKNSAE